MYSLKSCHWYYTHIIYNQWTISVSILCVCYFKKSLFWDHLSSTTTSFNLMAVYWRFLYLCNNGTHSGLAQIIRTQVRLSTLGLKPSKYLNTHPFVHDEWTLLLNKLIFSLLAQMRQVEISEKYQKFSVLSLILNVYCVADISFVKLILIKTS